MNREGLLEIIKAMGIQLEDWIEITNDGSWSTHLNKPMREKSSELFRIYMMESRKDVEQTTVGPPLKSVKAEGDK